MQKHTHAQTYTHTHTQTQTHTHTHTITQTSRTYFCSRSFFTTVYVLFYTLKLTFFPQSAGAINTIHTFGSNGLNPKKHRINVRSARQEAAKAFFYVKERNLTWFVLKTRACFFFFFRCSFLFWLKTGKQDCLGMEIGTGRFSFRKPTLHVTFFRDRLREHPNSALWLVRQWTSQVTRSTRDKGCGFWRGGKTQVAGERLWRGLSVKCLLAVLK